jgi:hypothetical protein
VLEIRESELQGDEDLWMRLVGGDTGTCPHMLICIGDVFVWVFMHGRRRKDFIVYLAFAFC